MPFPFATKPAAQVAPAPEKDPIASALEAIRAAVDDAERKLRTGKMEEDAEGPPEASEPNEVE
jgi:hypothetical protein